MGVVEAKSVWGVWLRFGHGHWEKPGEDQIAPSKQTLWVRFTGKAGPGFGVRVLIGRGWRLSNALGRPVFLGIRLGFQYRQLWRLNGKAGQL